MGNNLTLTQTKITAIAGQPAFLPNQPLIHNCVVDPSAEGKLAPGDVVTFASTSLKNLTVVKKAAATDIPCGVVAYANIKTGYVANDRITIYPVNSFVYLPAGAANLTNGTKVGVNSSGQVVAATESGDGIVGTLWTQPSAVGDLVVVQVQPSFVGADSSDYLTTAAAEETYQPKLTAGDFIAIDADTNTITTTYTAGTNITISDEGAISYSA